MSVSQNKTKKEFICGTKIKKAQLAEAYFEVININILKKKKVKFDSI